MLQRVLVLIVAMLVVLGWPRASVSQEAATPPPQLSAITSIDQLRLDPGPAAPKRSDIEKFVARWMQQLDPASMPAAFDLLEDAPPEVIEALVERLRGTGLVERVFEASKASTRSRLLNSLAVGRANLREFFAKPFTEELRAALARNEAVALASLAASSGDFRTLSPDVSAAMLDVLEAENLQSQVRQEFAAALVARAMDLAPHADRLRGWMSATGQSDAVEQRRRVARTVLLRLGGPMPEGELRAALTSEDSQMAAAGVDFLATHASDAQVRQHRLDLARSLFETNDPVAWRAAYSVFEKRLPATLEEIYSTITEQRVNSAWPSGIQAEFILRAPATYDAKLARWNDAVPIGNGGGLRGCDDLRRILAVNERRARVEDAVIAKVWRLVAVEPHECREDISAEFERTLATAVTGSENLKTIESAFLKQGAGQLPSMGLQVASLSRALMPVLYSRLDSGDLKAADAMIGMGLVPSSIELTRSRYWASLFGVNPIRTLTDTDLRIQRAMGQAPDTVIRAVVALVEDEGADVTLRAQGLLALSMIDEIKPHGATYLKALSDTNVVLSRTALILLANAAARQPAALKGMEFPLDVMQNVRTQPDLANDALELLRRLAPHSDDLAAEYAEQAEWKNGVSKPCFSLAMAPTVGTPIAVSLLNTAASAGEPDGANLRACARLLLEPDLPAALLARHWESMPTEPAAIEHILGQLLLLWKDQEFATRASAPLEGRMRLIVTAYAPQLDYSLSTQPLLSSWRDALGTEYQDDADDLAQEHRRRSLILFAFGIPVALLVHLAVWAGLLSFYPSSPRLQSVVFWNPMLRKILGLGYIDLVLLYVPLARRRLFLPFRSAFLGDIDQFTEEQLDRVDYFRDSSVIHRWRTFTRKNQDRSFEGMREPIVQALSRHRGRVLLLGKSGLGKSSFLRYWLANRASTGRDTIVYLRADECRDGVEFTIEMRMQLLGRDQNLLRSMLYAGRICVYIDGYNEVDIKTQDVITGFLANYPQGNILVASQIPMRGLTTIDSYELQPLDREQISAFLASRSAVLAESAPVRGEAFVNSAAAFLEDIWSRTGDEAKAFDEILSNPMDLTSVALLLGDARVPDVFALEAQQFESIRRHMIQHGTAFRTAGFSDALLKQRTADQENLEALPFNPEVVELVRTKMALVRTYTDASGRVASQEVRFRHDRIRDYFTHFAFMAMDLETRAKYAQDARFSGVYPFLARALAPQEAEELRERLIGIAAEIEDHRISDSFVREYSWRQRFASRDPAWMLAYDLPDARAVEARFEALARDRERVETEMNDARTRLAAARRLTRVLATADSADLLAIARELWIALGAQVDAEPSPTSARALRTPTGKRFFIAALGQPEAIRPFHLDLLLVRLAPLPQPIVLITNANVLMEPQSRPPDLSEESLARAKTEGLIIVSSQEIYAAYVGGKNSATAKALWKRIDPEMSNEAAPASVLT